MSSQSNRIIFLDIDGVLNGYSTMTHLRDRLIDSIGLRQLRLRYKWKHPVSLFKVFKLWVIVQATRAKIVLSSSWRYVMFSDNNKENISEDVKYLYKLFAIFGLTISDHTPMLPNTCREKEVLEYLKKHRDITYIILDDEALFTRHSLVSRLILTSNTGIVNGLPHENTGLKWKHVVKSIRKLGVCGRRIYNA